MVNLALEISDEFPWCMFLLDDAVLPGLESNKSCFVRWRALEELISWWIEVGQSGFWLWCICYLTSALTFFDNKTFLSSLQWQPLIWWSLGRGWTFFLAKFYQYPICLGVLTRPNHFMKADLFGNTQAFFQNIFQAQSLVKNCNSGQSHAYNLTIPFVLGH